MGSRLQSVCYLQQLLGLDVSVGLEVSLEVGALVKTALTYRTPVRSLLIVEYLQIKMDLKFIFLLFMKYYLVNCQGPRLTKSFPAVGAFKWFLFGMNVAVIPEIGRLTSLENTDTQLVSDTHLK